MSSELAAFCYERLAGAAIGAMCGDALGMPVEGVSADDIASQHGRITEMLPGRLPAGSYTDDTQMMIGILESFANKGGVDPEYLAWRFSSNFEPERGYGARIFGVVERIKAGISWDKCGTDSFGNGGAMRVGVIGAYYPDDPEAILKAALEQCSITHTHPQALAMSVALALCVGFACTLGAQGQRLRHEVICQGLADMVADIDPGSADQLDALPDQIIGSEDEVRSALIWRYDCDVRAVESVPPAIGCFLWSDSARQAIEMAVSLGGDTDTIAAMTGALAGAYWGIDALPKEWLDSLEDNVKGRNYVLNLCRQAVSAKCS